MIVWQSMTGRHKYSFYFYPFPKPEEQKTNVMITIQVIIMDLTVQKQVWTVIGYLSWSSDILSSEFVLNILIHPDDLKLCISF